MTHQKCVLVYFSDSFSFYLFVDVFWQQCLTSGGETAANDGRFEKILI